ncbi:hypothetical protein [Mesorhizobium sp.]|uniref:hypothetical protein n=1 Tax=Mesorhizobium sp. TaxID=1871066 RepID=UPI0025F8C57A|nr:hypothetical protein [Mesorhizobium sp.]
MDALIGEITGELNQANDGSDLDALAAKTGRALRFNVADARLYSLIGEIRYRQGETDEAFRLFDRARTLSKTEIHALQRSIDRSVRAGDLARAVGEIDILLRRWPDQFAVVAAGWPAILANAEGYQAVLAAIRSEAPWRSKLFASLGQNPRGLAGANQLLLDLAGSDTPPTSKELSAVINGYIKQKQYGPAYRLFIFSLSEHERKLGGYIFNGGFDPGVSGKPFDWVVHDRSGLEITFAGSRDAGESDRGATLRFLNTPVKNAALQQYIQLPAGSYRISMNASATNLRLPKGLFWSLRCIDPSLEIARFNIPEGTFNRRSLSLDFTVGPAVCPIQSLRLETEAIAQSWRFRYVGTLVMHKLSIERVSS